MAKNNTHRAAVRTVTPFTASTIAVRSAGGAAVLGTVLVGSAFGMQSATAAPAPAAAPAVSVAAAAPAAPVAQAAPAAVTLSSGSTLYRGVSSSRVADLQSALNENGASLTVDGKFGARTHAAVRDFQAANGLAVDGRVGPATRAALNGDAAPVSQSSASDTSSSSSSSSSSILDSGRTQIGKRYVWGSSNPSVGFDCSGLVVWAYSQNGISLPRTSGQIAAAGKTISQSQAQPGDIVAWPGHIGIYAGNGKVLDSAPSKSGVSERAIWGNPTFVTFR
ncbi:NlpC/P60 family protein [Brachybacterium sp. JHP9]|uniref:NlpC/P60 family protein n=1 Tax=Brachybacterium equifaecis TaxID=2910770 RepID=A0ABT0QWX6_9MICO|nr:NlpC/P60 family protein [Brachybacterium equifaecis]MCL6422175.1 NlpC/P60 family protein [Brachybacterium equifaecis]